MLGNFGRQTGTLFPCTFFGGATCSPFVCGTIFYLYDNIAIVDIINYTRGMAELKTCIRCGQIKEVSLFGPQRKDKTKASLTCKVCANSRHQRDLATKKAKADYSQRRKEILRAYRKKNPGKLQAHKAARRARKLQATPGWADLARISKIYQLANMEKQLTGSNVNVDHIVPLNSKLVCGLHVHYNLQITTDLYNFRKSNRKWPDMP